MHGGAPRRRYEARLVGLRLPRVEWLRQREEVKRCGGRECLTRCCVLLACARHFDGGNRVVAAADAFVEEDLVASCTVTPRHQLCQ